MRLRPAIITGLAIVGLEALIFALLIFANAPDPSVSIGIVIIAPFLFLVNVVLGLFFYFRKSTRIAVVIFINAIVAPVIFNFMWIFWYDGYSDRMYSQYLFAVGRDKFKILLSKDSKCFSIAEITDQQNGTSTNLYYGDYQVKGDTIVLVGVSNSMLIVDQMLYNFPRDSAAIRLIQPD
jgi:hypothetical protein